MPLLLLLLFARVGEGALVHGFSCVEVGVVFGVRGGGLDVRDSSVRRIGFLYGV